MKPRHKWWIPVSVMAVILWALLHHSNCRGEGWECGGWLLVGCFFLVMIPFSVGRFFQHQVDKRLLNEITPGLGETIEEGMPKTK
jgi:hypothetical protein